MHKSRLCAIEIDCQTPTSPRVDEPQLLEQRVARPLRALIGAVNSEVLQRTLKGEPWIQ